MQSQRFKLIHLSKEQWSAAKKDGALFARGFGGYFEGSVPPGWVDFIEAPEVPKGPDERPESWWMAAPDIEERGAAFGLAPDAFGPRGWQSFRVAVLDAAEATGERLPRDAWPEYQGAVRVPDWRGYVGRRGASDRAEDPTPEEAEEARARSIGAYLDELPKLRAALVHTDPDPRAWARRLLAKVEAGTATADEYRVQLAREAIQAPGEGPAGPTWRRLRVDA
jgi:hypothetical protein